MKKFAKKGLTEKDVLWVDQSRNEEYWAANMDGVMMGDKQLNKDQKYQ